MARVHAELIPVQPSCRRTMPVISHNGNIYVVAEPGTEWKLLVHITHPKEQQIYRAFVTIDGQCIGYSKVNTPCSHASVAIDFSGIAHTERDGRLSYTAFKFGTLKPAAAASTVEHPDEIAAGKIEVQVEAVVKVGTSAPCPVADVRWGNGAANKKLPEGKKWFLQPGLKAEVGSTVTKSNQTWSTAQYSVLYKLPAYKLRYDTAESLVLRKILDPNKPAHRAILSANKDSRIAAMGRSQPAAAGRQTTIKSERRVAGVKRERDQQGVQQQQDDMPCSATAETINLIEDAAATVPPLTVDGHALAADEMAVCDLLDSDDEPDWKVAKKDGNEPVVV